MEIESLSKTDIDRIRERMNLAKKFSTINAMAKELGCTEDYISMMLTGVKPLNSKWRTKITDYLNKFTVQNESSSAFNSR